MRHTNKKASGNKEEEEADKVTDRLRHKKVRKLTNKPHHKFLYSFDNNAPPALKTQ